MARITVVGGTGYAGSNIVREAASRGHEVTALARTAPAEPIANVTYLSVDVLNPDQLIAALEGAEIVVGALSPRGTLEGRIEGVMRLLAAEAQASGARLGVVGGAGSLLVDEGGPALADLDDFPAEIKPEADEMAAVLADLRAADERLDWFFLCPAQNFGAWAPGERTGVFRLGGDVLLRDADGNSAISGADFAQAFVDEIDTPRHHRQRFSVAY